MSTVEKVLASPPSIAALIYLQASPASRRNLRKYLRYSDYVLNSLVKDGLVEETAEKVYGLTKKGRSVTRQVSKIIGIVTEH